VKTVSKIAFLGLLLTSCLSKEYEVFKGDITKSNSNKKQFSLVSSSHSLIDFRNDVEETKDLNFLNFANIYNGGGVATGDFNNDGLADIFFVSNQNSNKLYLNKGDFQFEDITVSSGIADSSGWSTGVSTIDINNDGWLDLYVCKSGEFENPSLRENKLFINQKDNTFKESAKEWKINDPGFSTQSYFLDYDKDGDLDMYLLNHRDDFNNTGRFSREIERSFTRFTSDILYRNDGGFFTDVTHEAGVVNKAWGLSASIGDFNEDDWLDVYVCNDFLTPDILYINNQNGTFTNQILTSMNHISYSSMGSDYADINNDLLPDLLVLEMASEDHIRSKENMATMSTAQFKNLVDNGYHYQYMVNTLQLNQNDGQFSEIAQLSGLAKTDWSWAPLISDFDNDGFKDVFITNGIFKDMGNQDFLNKVNNKIRNEGNVDFNEIISIMPSTKLANYSYKNNGDLTFKNTSIDWGFDFKNNSNGAAYADFDNDGDLDLVINNINEEAQIYQNNDSKNFIQFRLTGSSNNSLAIGTEVIVKIGNQKQNQNLFLNKGFLSSVQNVLNFGLGESENIDEVTLKWPNGNIIFLNNLEANQIIHLKETLKNDAQVEVVEESKQPLKRKSPGQMGVSYTHVENQHDDYKEQILLPLSQSKNGPFIDKADINGDGLEDFFVGGAAGQQGQLYIQNSNATFTQQEGVWSKDSAYEDLGVLFFDADNDQDQDLYIVSGGAEFKNNSTMFQDRLYLNDGQGNFEKSKNTLPLINSSGQIVKVTDIDLDGDQDLFVGGRIVPNKYPYAPESLILINENGSFENKTRTVAPEIKELGMVTDAEFSDYDNDGDDDLIVVGEWMSITVFENIDGKFSQKESKSLEDSEGSWFSIESIDIDGDGDLDYFVGNLGMNTKFKASKKKPFEVYCDDFDNSGTFDIVLTSNYQDNLVPSRGRECSSQQMPFILDKFPTYKDFAEATLTDIYGEENLQEALHKEIKTLKSVFLENIGGGEFNIIELPNLAQMAPIMDFEFVDLNEDGKKEIIIVGNHYNPEVETVRYDASYGAILSFSNRQESKFEILSSDETGFKTKGDAKNLISIKTERGELIIVVNNNKPLNIFELQRGILK
jgi:hypothetical protein